MPFEIFPLLKGIIRMDVFLYVQKPCCNLSFSFNYLRDFPDCLELRSHFEYHFHIPSFQKLGGPSLSLSLWWSNKTPFSGPPVSLWCDEKSELIGMFRLPSAVLGAIHKRLQQFWGWRGSKNSCNLPMDKSKKMPTWGRGVL